MSLGERANAVAAFEAEEARRGTRRAVAGFDYTFSVPKSASVLWAVADAGTQALIAETHHAAVAETVAFIEREVAATPVGATGPDGAVAQVDVTGVIATAFEHYDSRAGDPHLHTHVVITNKVQTAGHGLQPQSCLGHHQRITGEVGSGVLHPRPPHRSGEPHSRRLMASELCTWLAHLPGHAQARTLAGRGARSCG
ncbi:MAG TPA: relaxase domain-containing protein [Candidatus Ruania gallistercoris]|uniref:Relaxase domain-containing protein n=1 Tax=Candidatus Ruania gallistercoris TaxID=2838746 RepID=A0A9D2EFP5_9MICO|nr:relaxase domain-containing protein [Candidatus Ruania gallistercoris]